MHRYWLLTSTFYGNWLPGDERGFVSRVRDVRLEDDVRAGKSRHRHNIPGTPYDEDFRGLHRHAQQELRGDPVRIDHEQAQVLLKQFQETACYRGWVLLAVAIMSNHIHIVVGADGDPDPTRMLGDFKAYGSRALSACGDKPASKTWWTYGGSKRKLPDEAAVLAAVEYVHSQPSALVIWIASGVA